MIHFDIASLIEEKGRYDELINAEDFWLDQKEALKVVNKANTIKEKLDSYNALFSSIESSNELLYHNSA